MSIVNELYTNVRDVQMRTKPYAVHPPLIGPAAPPAMAPSSVNRQNPHPSLGPPFGLWESTSAPPSRHRARGKAFDEGPFSWPRQPRVWEKWRKEGRGQRTLRPKLAAEPLNRSTCVPRVPVALRTLPGLGRVMLRYESFHPPSGSSCGVAKGGTFATSANSE